MAIGLNMMKIMKSVRSDGYQMGNVEVIDGEVNNLFGNFGEVDYSAGAFDIRKAYLWGASNDTSIFADAWVAVTAPPTNPNTTVALFTTGDHFDNTASHKAYLEKYLDAGARMQWLPQETQYVDSMVLNLWARLNTHTTQPIEVGSTYILESSNQSQALRVVEVNYSTITQTDPGSEREYTVDVAEVRIAAPLKKTYSGSTISRFAPINPPTVWRKTVNSGATRLYGIMQLSADLPGGSSMLEVDSIYGQVIPAGVTTYEMVDQSAAGRSVNYIPSAAGTIEFTHSLNIGVGLPVYLGSPIEPNSLLILGSDYTLTESGGGLYSGTTQVATIVHESGLILPLDSCPLYTGDKTIRFKPVGLFNQPQQSTSILVTVANQSRTYSINLGIKPAKGSVSIAYLAGGQWYELFDNGAAIVGAQPEYGSATVTALNTLTMTLGTAPDVDSRILIFWGVSSFTFDRAATAVPKAYFEITTANAFGHNGVSLAWNDGVARTATLSEGVITGDATGEQTGPKSFKFRPNVMPAAGTSLTVTITPYASATETFDASTVVSAGTAYITLANADVKAKSVRVQYSGLVVPGQAPAATPMSPVWITGGTNDEWIQAITDPQFYSPASVITQPQAHTADPTYRDNGSGGFTGLSGSINLSAGTLAIPATVNLLAPAFSWALAGIPGSLSRIYNPTGWTYDTESAVLGGNGKLIVSYVYGNSEASTDETFTLSNAKIELVPNTIESVITGSYRGTFTGKNLYELAGAVYADLNNGTGNAVQVGTMNLASRVITLSIWTSGGANSPAVSSLSTSLGQPALSQVAIKVTPPIKSGGFSVRAIQLDGTAIEATVDVSGVLSADGILGTVDLEQGVALVRFGEMVTASGNEGQPWYSASDIVSGQIFKPIPVYSRSILYNASIENRSTLPSDVIDTDTARYPQNGQIELARARDLLYIHHTDTLSVSSPSAGQAINCGRIKLERVWIKDSNGDDVPATLYTADANELDAGIFHLVTDGFTTSGHPTPWTVFHRISDLRVVGYVGRFGSMKLSYRPTHADHDFPTGSYVSSVLFAGDLQAGWTPPVARTLWPGNFNDPTGGTEATAGYDWGNYPPTVANNGVTAPLKVAFVFQDATHFRCIIDGIGQIDSGVPITADYAPINPATGQPFFTLQGNVGADEPWGTGWSANWYLYMEFPPSTFSFEVIRTLMPSDPPLDPEDSAVIEFHCREA